VRPTFLKGVVLGAAVSSVTLVASAAFAGTGVGGIFNLGKYNPVNATTELAGSTNGNQLSVVNTSTGTNAAGIGISVHSGHPPLTVNSSTQVKNLNASYLGGIAQNGFMHGNGNVSQSGLIEIPPGSKVSLGPVSNIGVLWGNCLNANATEARVVLETNNALGSFLLTDGKGAFVPGSGGQNINVTDDTGADTGTIYIATGTHTATITATAFNLMRTDCLFFAQSTSSG
jgi:hypothetical protein